MDDVWWDGWWKMMWWWWWQFEFWNAWNCVRCSFKDDGIVDYIMGCVVEQSRRDRHHWWFYHVAKKSVDESVYELKRWVIPISLDLQLRYYWLNNIDEKPCRLMNDNHTATSCRLYILYIPSPEDFAILVFIISSSSLYAIAGAVKDYCLQRGYCTWRYAIEGIAN